MTPEEYKKLSIKEFTQAAKMSMTADMLVFMKCARMITHRFWLNWKKKSFTMCWTADAEQDR